MEGVGSLIQTLRGFRALDNASRFGGGGGGGGERLIKEEEMRSLKRSGPTMRRKQKKRRRKRRRALRQTESHNILGRKERKRGEHVGAPRRE